MLTVNCVDTLDGFEGLRDQWNQLSESGGTIFQTWEWCWTWWQRYGKRRKLFIICVWDCGKLVGLAPLFISTYFGLPFKVASFLGTGCSDYGDFLIEADRADAIVGAMIPFLEEDRRWDVLDLQQLSPESSALRLESMLRSFPMKRLLQDECYFLQMPETYQDLLTSLSKKFRWNVQYYKRRLEREGRMEFRRCSDPNIVVEDVETFFRLHQKRFVSKKKLGRFLSPRFTRFHKEVAARLLDEERLGLYTLSMDGEPVASLYGFELGKTFYYYLAGFEPDWGRLSVSTVLLSLVFEDCLGRGLTGFDFLRGAEPYKLKWGATGSHNSRLVVGRSTHRAEFIHKLIQTENRLVVHAKARAAEV